MTRPCCWTWLEYLNVKRRPAVRGGRCRRCGKDET